MPNHVHLILVPADDTGLSRAIGEAHRCYSSYINARLRETGHLFQGRFGSVAMDELHLLAAFRYVAMNPVKAKMVTQASDWACSSTKAHLDGKDDDLVSVRPLLDRVDNISEFLATTPEQELELALEKGQSIGRPLMEESALVKLERKLGRPIRPAKRGRPKRTGEHSSQMKLV